MVYWHNWDIFYLVFRNSKCRRNFSTCHNANSTAMRQGAQIRCGLEQCKMFMIKLQSVYCTYVLTNVIQFRDPRGLV